MRRVSADRRQLVRTAALTRPADDPDEHGPCAGTAHDRAARVTRAHRVQRRAAVGIDRAHLGGGPEVAAVLGAAALPEALAGGVSECPQRRLPQRGATGRTIHAGRSLSEDPHPVGQPRARLEQRHRADAGHRPVELDDGDVVAGPVRPARGPRGRERDPDPPPRLAPDLDALEVAQVDRVRAVRGGRHPIGRDQHPAADPGRHEPRRRRWRQRLPADDRLGGRGRDEAEQQRGGHHHAVHDFDRTRGRACERCGSPPFGATPAAPADASLHPRIDAARVGELLLSEPTSKPKTSGPPLSPSPVVQRAHFVLRTALTLPTTPA